MTDSIIFAYEPLIFCRTRIMFWNNLMFYSHLSFMCYLRKVVLQLRLDYK